MFKKLLIANRGEIAVRILRACRELQITGVAVYSEVDRASLHVRMADEAYPIGPAAARESYLRIDKLMEIARRAGCDALHPGYGFLAENAELPRACAEAGIAFVGPSAEAMEKLGSKTAARQLAHRAGVPMVPGVREPIPQLSTASRIAEEIGYPDIAESRGRRRRKRHAGSRQRERTASGMARCGFRSSECLRRRARLHREIFGPAPAHRDTDLRRRTRKRYLPWRTRMLHTAAPSESDRGSALAFYDS